MKPIINLVVLLFTLNSFAQKNMDTIYGNPKSVKENVQFLNKDKQNYKYMYYDGDYGHSTIFHPIYIKNRFYRFWYREINCFYINYEKKFKKNGKAKNEVWYNKDGSIERKYEYNYEKSSILKTTKEYYYDNEFLFQKYYYDEENRLIASIKNYSEDPNEFYHSYFDRDNNGNIIKSTSFNENGSSVSTFRIYNNKDKLMRTVRSIPNKWRNNEHINDETIFDSLEIRRNIKKFEYDKNENLILESSYNEDNKVSRKTTYKYNNNNLIERTSYGNPKNTSSYFKTIYKYNEQNLRIKEDKIYSGKIEKSTSTIYDDKNFIVQIKIEEKNKNYIIDYKYKFDEKGNWVKITKIVNSEPLFEWTRKIKYY